MKSLDELDEFILDFVEARIWMDYIIWYCHADWRPVTQFVKISKKFAHKAKFVFVDMGNIPFTIGQTKEFIDQGT